MRHVLAVGVLVLIVLNGCVTPKSRPETDEPDSGWSPALDGPMPVRDSGRGGYWWQPSLDDPDAVGNRGVLFSRGPARRRDEPLSDLHLDEIPPLAPVVGHPVRVIERIVPSDELPPLAPVVGHPVRVIERIVLSDVMFDYDRAELKPAGLKEIERMARYMQNNPEMLAVIEGHTDWIASEKYNLALGARRAEAVKKGLAARGVPDGRVTTVSFGESRPVASNETAEGRTLNRRAVINLVVPDDAGGPGPSAL